MAEPAPAGPPATVATLLATWLGTGLIPFAPGSFASLAALPCAALLIWGGGLPMLLLASAVVFVAGLWASGAYMTALGVHDPNAVVIDEIVGQWLTLAFAPLNPFAYLLGFFLFRVFDVFKPWPINLLDRLVPGAFGVMIDDVAAGLAAGVTLWLILWLFAIWGAA